VVVSFRLVAVERSKHKMADNRFPVLLFFPRTSICADFVSVVVFGCAQVCAPSIIFFDELDGLTPTRSAKQNAVHNSIVTTLLSLMDGSHSAIVLVWGGMGVQCPCLRMDVSVLMQACRVVR
jgi:hypothetical protein